MKTKLINVAKVVVTLGLLAVVLLTVDLRQVWEVIRRAQLGPILAALALYQVGIVVRSYRWQVLLEAQGVAIPLSRLVALYYIGTFFNSFLPSGFGGDVIKMYELSNHGTTGELAISTVLVDRIMGLLTLFAMALVVLPFSWQLVPSSVSLTLLALIAGSALGIALLMNRRLVNGLAARIGLVRKLLQYRKVAALYESFHRYTPAALAKATGASLVFNLLLIVTYHYLSRAIGIEISVGYFFVFVPILSALLTLPISISGFGVREVSYTVLFGQAGVAADLAVAMSLLFYALNVVTGLAGGALYVMQGTRAYRRLA